DFLNQEIGFRDYPAERLEYRKIKVLLFLLEHSGEYVTNSNLQLSSELNSVDLPKTISSIKSHIVNLLSYQYDKEYSVQLFSNIIDKHKVNGYMGYNLITKSLSVGDTDTVASAIEEVIPEIAKNIPEPSESSEISQVTTPTIQDYFRNSWLSLFLIAYLIITFFLVIDHYNIGLNQIVSHLTNIPFVFVSLILMISAFIPIILGKYVDRGNKFDTSKLHVHTFLLSNITGALTCLSLINYFRHIPTADEYLNHHNEQLPISFILFIGLAVALLMNFNLCTKPSEGRRGTDYYLKNLHAISNVIFVTFILFLSCSLIYILLKLCFVYHIKTGIYSSLAVVMMSSYLYLWFTSISPAANDLDSVSRSNFDTGIPLLSVVVLIYIFMNFSVSMPCIISICVILLGMAAWLIYIFKKRSELHLKLLGSLFNIMAAAVIISIIIEILI
ncbi:MAG: hypothetical protein IJ245_06205, partial [Lachnospiraceae bacterium]|nr:hypothetical protein [Lachnospiraceae bacterium]